MRGRLFHCSDWLYLCLHVIIKKDMMKYKYAIAAVIALLLFGGCATRGEINRFKVQIDYIEASNAALQRDVRRIDSLLTEEQKLIRSLKAEQGMNLAQLDQDMQVIVGLLNDSGTQVYKLDERIEDLRREIITPQYDTVVTDSTDTTITIEPAFNVDQLYDAAYLDQKRGDYEYAIKGYRQFIQEVADTASDLVDDAYYGMATSLMSQDKNDEASDVFQELIDKFPESERVPAAMYKRATIYTDAGKNDLAEIVFKKIIEKYPHTPESDLANDRLKELKGN